MNMYISLYLWQSEVVEKGKVISSYFFLYEGDLN